MAVPEFDQYVEYVTEGPVVHRVDLTQHSLDVLPTLQAVASGYAHAATLGRAADLTTAETTALKTQLAEVAYHSDMVRYATDASAAPGDIVAKLVEVKQRPDWLTGLAVQAGEVYAFEGNLYQAIQAHVTQADWTPIVAKALFKRFYEPSDDPWPWVQPTGGHDAYPVGARVTFGGYTWRNDIPANVWQPGVTGWTNLTPPPATPDWATGVAYKVNDVVAYQGNSYRCLQAHTSIQTWNPVATINVLWVRL